MPTYQPFRRLLALALGLTLFAGCAQPDAALPHIGGDVATSATQLSTQPLPARADGELRVHCIDVGQADSLFLELPDGKTMLIDAGNRGDDKKILAYLERQGCKRIDYMIATHPHADHIGSMAELITSLEVGAFYMPKVSHTSSTFERMIDALAQKNLKIKVAKAGVSIPSEGYELDFVAPVQAEYENLNNYSAVLHLRYGSRAFLFTGDAETLSEEQIEADIRSDLLKVGHHGSSTSTSDGFLERVSPDFAVIPVGLDNSYGHPSDQVLNRLQRAGVSVARTDQNGSIVYCSDGETISVHASQESKGSDAPAPIPSEPPNSSAEASDYVWASGSGTKYHAIPNCGTMKSATELTRAQALAKGLDACSRCNP